MAGWLGGLQKSVLDMFIRRPVHVYLAGGAFLCALREYQVRTAYNYWFGKFEFERGLAGERL